MYTIGRLARKTGLRPDSIRFYERQGLLQAAEKTASGYHLYTDDAARRLIFIKRAQRCGFQLAEIRQLLAIEEASAESDAAYDLAAQKCREIGATIEELQLMSATLTRVLDARGSAAVPSEGTVTAMRRRPLQILLAEPKSAPEPQEQESESEEQPPPKAEGARLKVAYKKARRP